MNPDTEPISSNTVAVQTSCIFNLMIVFADLILIGEWIDVMKMGDSQKRIPVPGSLRCDFDVV